MRSLLIITCLAIPLTACETTAQKVCRGERGLEPGSQAYADCEKAEYDKIAWRIRRTQNIGNK
ncbi:hypothetical protein [Pelagibius sp. Alg239-R121]|uniref:hypothetical protein n=1 Tax=Pelagibius sp. Alg239-R121 TaxID=2993448 RepID=UPI0024A66DDD|nr:hypothetical protein [Pelagibius sp. Alg239-R121]